MAEKTEQPTPKRLREARKRGEVAKSSEVPTAAIVLALGATLAFTAEASLEALKSSIRIAIAGISLGAGPHALGLLKTCAWLGIQAVAPLLAVLLGAGLIANFVQVGPLLSWQAFAPRWERLSPRARAGQLISGRQAVEWVKALVKVGVVATLAAMTLSDETRGIADLARGSTSRTLAAIGSLGLQLIFRVGTALAALALLDWSYQRWRYRHERRMTREETKREQRESEGDPQSKQQRTRMHRDLATHDRLRAVRDAAILIVDGSPSAQETAAVALHYDQEDPDKAPTVMAKGQGAVAERMQAVATEADVAIASNATLCQDLQTVPIGGPIPRKHYNTVASLLRRMTAVGRAS